MAGNEPLIRIRLDRPPFDPGELRRAVGEEVSAREVELVVTDPGIMRALNRRWRHQDRVTDVLTFDLSADPCPGGPAGVIYVNGRVAPPLREVLERVCHGLLHLEGLSHHTPEERSRMEERTEQMVGRALERTGAC
jgi:ssRNA-specific RNase YbeY (16S rRNA maturation enzyme)